MNGCYELSKPVYVTRWQAYNAGALPGTSTSTVFSRFSLHASQSHPLRPFGSQAARAPRAYSGCDVLTTQSVVAQRSFVYASDPGCTWAITVISPIAVDSSPSAG